MKKHFRTSSKHEPEEDPKIHPRILDLDHPFALYEYQKNDLQPVSLTAM